MNPTITGSRIDASFLAMVIVLSVVLSLGMIPVAASLTTRSASSTAG